MAMVRGKRRANKLVARPKLTPTHKMAARASSVAAASDTSRRIKAHGRVNLSRWCAFREGRLDRAWAPQARVTPFWCFCGRSLVSTLSQSVSLSMRPEHGDKPRHVIAPMPAACRTHSLGDVDKHSCV
jgi:hypothetical protein